MIHKSLKVPIRCAIPVFSKSGAAPEPPPPPRPVSLVMYGRLYTASAVGGKILITGLSNPTTTDGTNLNTYVNSNHNVAPNDFGVGNHLKHCRQSSSPLGAPCATSVDPYWQLHATNYGRNTLKFGGLAAGQVNSTGTASLFRQRLQFWLGSYNSTSSYYFSLRYDTDTSSQPYMAKTTRNSVRLCRNASTEEQLLPDGTIVAYVFDFEGNQYDLVRIGPKVWTVQNFAGTKYSDGTDISDLKFPNNSESNVFFANAEASIWKYE